MLPEITSAVKGFLLRREERARPLSLDLKSDLSNPESFYRAYPQIGAAAGAWSPAWSGESVTVDTALNHSVFYTCKRIICESTCLLPLSMMQREKAGDKIEAVHHPMFSGLRDAPNDEMTAMRFRETLTGHCAVGGNAYAQIMRRSGTGAAMELWPLLPSQVTPDREKTGQKRLTYVVKEGNSPDKTHTVERNKPHTIFHMPGLGWDGIRGYSVLRLACQSMGNALAAERNLGRFWARGGRVPYNLKLTQKFANDEQAAKFREDFERVAADPSKMFILEPWLEYEKTGLSMVDAQLLETRQFSVPEICRWFRISPHLAGDLSNANNSITEQLALEFVNFTLMVWLKRWEQELWRCVLTPEEKGQGYFWRHNVNALLRGDFATRMAGYASALQNGHMCVDEVRDLEDRNQLPDGAGEHFHIQLNMQALPEGNQPLTSQTAQLVRLGSQKGGRPR